MTTKDLPTDLAAALLEWTSNEMQYRIPQYAIHTVVPSVEDFKRWVFISFFHSKHVL